MEIEFEKSTKYKKLERHGKRMSYKFSKEFGRHSLLHTPEGVRDIYNGECEKKLHIQENLHHVFKLYGFQDIQTPSFEFFDIFNRERGTIASKEMYKFFDREGNTLVLRPDITPSIARCVAKYFKEEELPMRLCYMGNTFINNSSYQGKLKETTQLGAELINDDTSDADAEMIALTIECLLQAGLKEFQVEIGHADFFLSLLEEANFDLEEAEELKNLIESKNMFGMEELVSRKPISDELKELFLKLPELFGSLENLSYAKERIKNQGAKNALIRLEKVYSILETYELSKYVTFDLGMLSKYNYYTGIIFKAYTYGTGEAIVKGGRYDNLVQQFGKDAKAIGMAIVVDQLMAALSRQKIEDKTTESTTLILYEGTYRKTAIDLAGNLRSKHTQVELVRKSSKREVSDYIELARRKQMETIIHIVSTEFAEIIAMTEKECVSSVEIKTLLENK